MCSGHVGRGQANSPNVTDENDIENDNENGSGHYPLQLKRQLRDPALWFWYHSHQNEREKD